MNTFEEEMSNLGNGEESKKVRDLAIKFREATEKDLHIAIDAFGYAIADLMRPKGLKESKRPYWTRLIGKNGYVDRLPCSDHDSLWNKDGKPYVYVMQPYATGMKKFEELIQICKKNKLTFFVDPYSFHNPLGTISIKLYKDDDEHKSMNTALNVK